MPSRMTHLHPFIAKHYRYAIVGASDNPEKYGNIILRDLLRANFTVLPVNPKGGKVEGLRVYKSLKEIHPAPDVAVVVVPPSVGLAILDDAKAAGVTRLIFQPGAESEGIRTKAKQLGLNALADGSCVMVMRRMLGVG